MTITLQRCLTRIGVITLAIGTLAAHGAWDYTKWSTDWKGAKREAAESGHPLLMMIGSLDNCSHCQDTWAAVLCDGGVEHWVKPTSFGEVCTAVNDGHPWAVYAAEKKVVLVEMSIAAGAVLFNTIQEDYRAFVPGGFSYPAFLLFHVGDNANLDDNSSDAFEPSQVDCFGGFEFYTGDVYNGVLVAQTFTSFKNVYESYFPNAYFASTDPVADNNAPVIDEPTGILNVGRNTTTTINLTVSDPDQGDTFIITVETGPAKGTVQLVNPTSIGAAVQYTPGADLNANGGSDSFTLKITDAGGLPDTATFTVQVEPPPANVAPDITPANIQVQGWENGPGWVCRLPLAVSDDHDTPAELVYEVVDPPALGTVEIFVPAQTPSRSAAMPVAIYTPGDGFVASSGDQFEVAVTDSLGASDQATINIGIDWPVSDGGILTIKPGWNFFCFAFTPDAQATSDILAAAAGGLVWDWKEAQGAYQVVTTFAAYQGYSLYSSADGNVPVTVHADNTRAAVTAPELQEGWNLVGKTTVPTRGVTAVSTAKFWSDGAYYDQQGEPQSLPPVTGYWLLGGAVTSER